MYKDVLSSIEGIDIFPIISLLIFVVFFVGLIIWAFKMDKQHLQDMAAMPLDTDYNSENATLSSGRINS